jgi:hypothetical protein
VVYCCKCIKAQADTVKPRPITQIHLPCMYHTKPNYHHYCEEGCVILQPHEPRPMLAKKMMEVPWANGCHTYPQWRNKNPANESPDWYCHLCYWRGSKISVYNCAITTWRCNHRVETATGTSVSMCKHGQTRQDSDRPWPPLPTAHGDQRWFCGLCRHLGVSTFKNWQSEERCVNRRVKAPGTNKTKCNHKFDASVDTHDLNNFPQWPVGHPEV